MRTINVEFGLREGKREVVPFQVDGPDDYESDCLAKAIVNYWNSDVWRDKGIELPTPEELIEIIKEDGKANGDRWIDTLYYIDNLDCMFGDYNDMFGEKWFRVVGASNKRGKIMTRRELIQDLLTTGDLDDTMWICLTDRNGDLTDAVPIERIEDDIIIGG